MDPLLTIFIPVRNGGRFFRRLIESFPVERPYWCNLVVVDGRSTDGSDESARALCTRWGGVFVNQDPKGIYAAWNAGLALVNTEWTYILCADDELTDDFWRLGERLFAGEGDAVDILVYNLYLINEKGERLGDLSRYSMARSTIPGSFGTNHDFPLWQSALFAWFFRTWNISFASLVFRTSLRDTLFKEDVGSTADADWILAVSVSGARWRYVARVIGAWRIHDGGSTANMRPHALSERNYEMRRDLVDRLCDLVPGYKNVPHWKMKEILLLRYLPIDVYLLWTPEIIRKNPLKTLDTFWPLLRACGCRDLVALALGRIFPGKFRFRAHVNAYNRAASLVGG